MQGGEHLGLGGRSRVKEQGLTILGSSLDAGEGVKGSIVLKPCIGDKGVALRCCLCLALCYPLVNQEELCWFQERAGLASLCFERGLIPNASKQV